MFVDGKWCYIFIITIGLVLQLHAALLRCPDCSSEVSSRISACPKCGCPTSAMVAGENNVRQAGSAIDGIFATTQDSLLLVDTGQAKGSAFIAGIDGRKYILTNAHVIQGANSLSFTDIQGNRVAYKSIELCKEHDIARLELQDQSLPSLSFDNSALAIGLPIVVLGNSQGSSVITELKGSVLSIGPETLEVNAEFVAGNSGSPIVTKDGNIVGIATYVTYTPGRSDWVLSGTRFGEVRRFGLRVLPTYTWTNTTLNQMSTQVQDMEQFSKNITDLYLVYYRAYMLSKTREYQISNAHSSETREASQAILNAQQLLFDSMRQQQIADSDSFRLFLREYTDCCDTSARYANAIQQYDRASQFKTRQRLESAYKKKHGETLNKTHFQNQLNKLQAERSKLLDSVFTHLYQYSESYEWIGGELIRKRDEEVSFLRSLQEKFDNLEETQDYKDSKVWYINNPSFQ